MSFGCTDDVVVVVGRGGFASPLPAPAPRPSSLQISCFISCITPSNSRIRDRNSDNCCACSSCRRLQLLCCCLHFGIEFSLLWNAIIGGGGLAKVLAPLQLLMLICDIAVNFCSILMNIGQFWGQNILLAKIIFGMV